jgi:hypothetical protein
MRARSCDIDPEDTDRHAGFLTQTEREYLLGTWAPGEGAEPGEFTEEQERPKRSDIRTRTRHALADIALLQNRGDPELIHELIQVDGKITTYHEDTLEHVQYGLTQFMINVALPIQQGPEIAEQLQNESQKIADAFIDLEVGELLESEGVGEKELDRLHEQHSQAVEWQADVIAQWSDDYGIEKEDMLELIRREWE